MTLMNSLVFILVLALVAWLAWWIITHFFPAPARTPVLLIVGVILLLILLLLLLLMVLPVRYYCVSFRGAFSRARGSALE